MYNQSDIPPEDLLSAEEEMLAVDVGPEVRTAAVVEAERVTAVCEALTRVARGEATVRDQRVVDLLASVTRDDSTGGA